MTCCHNLPAGTCPDAWCKEQHWKATVEKRLKLLNLTSLADADHIKALSERLAKVEARRQPRRKAKVGP